MKKLADTLMWVLIIVLFLSYFVDIDNKPKPDPDPDPDPKPIVESPFPESGYWLAILSSTGDGKSAQLVGASDKVRIKTRLATDDKLNYKWIPYSKTDLDSPWAEAKKWAENKGGQAYFIARHGDKAFEGPLTGSVNEMSKLVVAAVDEIYESSN